MNVMVNYTYIKIYSPTKTPHVLSKFVHDQLVLAEVAYETYAHGVGKVLARNKTNTWPKFPIIIGSYSIKNDLEDEMMVDHVKMYHFGEERFHHHVPVTVV